MWGSVKFMGDLRFDTWYDEFYFCEFLRNPLKRSILTILDCYRKGIDYLLIN